jgi:hypothetical protein
VHVLLLPVLLLSLLPPLLLCVVLLPVLLAEPRDPRLSALHSCSGALLRVAPGTLAAAAYCARDWLCCACWDKDASLYNIFQ